MINRIKELPLERNPIVLTSNHKTILNLSTARFAGTLSPFQEPGKCDD